MGHLPTSDSSSYGIAHVEKTLAVICGALQNNAVADFLDVSVKGVKLCQGDAALEHFIEEQRAEWTKFAGLLSVDVLPYPYLAADLCNIEDASETQSPSARRKEWELLVDLRLDNCFDPIDD
eukprot:TRINITY_DN2917_c0_g1_i1.p1 TRINITY_DN2917_c0_g1~~TRINITY_DN2917_c0_g1_i1.p1  ORF type:complete len:122 (-),score=19.78 TRINITY_DN2917_c0_g1_i1:111-476(-)